MAVVNKEVAIECSSCKVVNTTRSISNISHHQSFNIAEPSRQPNFTGANTVRGYRLLYRQTLITLQAFVMQLILDWQYVISHLSWTLLSAHAKPSCVFQSYNSVEATALEALWISDMHTILMASFNAESCNMSKGIWFTILPPLGIDPSYKPSKAAKVVPLVAIIPSSIFGPDWFSEAFFRIASALALPMNRFFGVAKGKDASVKVVISLE